ncbi:hypothetical protein CNEO3_1410005 [Clostridium neonatale]|nr:hypothetical protein CNEO_10031 [Clostridium neonatale]CAI3541765.1 hypothetical protein CNEO3_1640003 [Clostridium neonatale]CAI3558566.1 hypothetical protein CNEO3_1240003 [Clostridium neonatale]CAI3560628.1 hypothetical protein CNEO2_1190010 [Clostridium neonatale]CAI3570866.1 hypothetical protein CNEO3_1400003 [Clostridium neonatale]
MDIQNTYYNIEDIPSDECDKNCSVLKNIILVYKVLGEN